MSAASPFSVLFDPFDGDMIHKVRTTPVKQPAAQNLTKQQEEVPKVYVVNSGGAYCSCSNRVLACINRTTGVYVCRNCSGLFYSARLGEPEAAPTDGIVQVSRGEPFVGTDARYAPTETLAKPGVWIEVVHRVRTAHPRKPNELADLNEAIERMRKA